LKDFPSLPEPNSDSFIYQNRFIIDELNYDKIEMSEMHCSLFQTLTPEQGSLGEYNDNSPVKPWWFLFLIWLWGNWKNFHVKNFVHRY